MKPKPFDERGETLAHDAMEIRQMIGIFQDRLAKIEAELDGYFTGCEGVEKVSSEFAQVTRLTDTRLWVNPQQNDKVFQMLGSTFEKYFKLNIIAYPTPECRELLGNQESRLALALSDFMVTATQRIFTYSEGRVQRAQTEDK